MLLAKHKTPKAANMIVTRCMGKVSELLNETLAASDLALHWLTGC